MRKLYILCLIGLACIIIGLAFADQMTFTTYYPAPYGVYREMKVNLLHTDPQSLASHPNVPMGEEAQWEGKMYYNDGSLGIPEGYYYYDGTTWLSSGGELWTRSGNDVYLADTAWNVGIGTTQPAATLHIKRDQDARTGIGIENRDLGVRARAELYLQGERGDDYAVMALFSPNSPSADPFYPDSFEIGTGSALVNGMLVCTRGPGPLRFATQSTERMRITPGGNVGIGTNTPGYKLHVAGTAGKPGGGSWSDSSDIRLKKNVKTIEGALETMLRLRGINYQWKEPEKHGGMKGTYMGMIAQEAEKVFPEWVGTGNEGYKTLGFIGFEALAVEAIKELKSENEVLKARIEALEAKFIVGQ